MSETMPRLPSLSAAANVAVVGASGGIGSAMLQLLAGDEGVARVFALSRGDAAFAQHPKIVPNSIDITDEKTIAAAANACGRQGPLDLVVVATGILHEGEGLRPEKRMRDLDAEVMRQVFTVNAVGPAIVGKHFLPLLRSGHKTVFAALSARVGSIGDNRLGGWASYRASKAALNMFLKTLSIEHARARPDSVIAALHPGTVDTRLSQPFQGGVPAGKLFSPEFAAERLLAVIDGLSAADTGGVFAWDGSPVEY